MRTKSLKPDTWSESARLCQTASRAYPSESVSSAAELSASACSSRIHPAMLSVDKRANTDVPAT